MTETADMRIPKEWGWRVQQSVYKTTQCVTVKTGITANEVMQSLPPIGGQYPGNTDCLIKDIEVLPIRRSAWQWATGQPRKWRVKWLLWEPVKS